MRDVVRWVWVLLVFAACASEVEPSGPDLPAGWEAAERVEELTQRPCGGSAFGNEGPAEALGWSASDDGVRVTYDHAHFRCEQDVEGFVRRSRGALDLLIQPIDMNPTAIAGCDCLFDISLEVPTKAGDYTLKLYRRWDNFNDPNTPVEIDEASVSLP